MKKRTLRALGVLLIAANLLVAVPVFAQSGDDKPAPIDTYPLPNEAGASRYSLVDRWNKTGVTFYFHNCPSTLDCATAQDLVRQAFATWDGMIALNFSEAASAAQADIEIEWTLNGDGFGKPGGVLAMEIGSKQGPAVTKLFAAAVLKSIVIKKDAQGLERFAIGALPV